MRGTGLREEAEREERGEMRGMVVPLGVIITCVVGEVAGIVPALARPTANV